MFNTASFIKPNIPFVREDSLAPMFRKTFTYNGKIEKAELSVCALGFGYVYINGRKITEDLLAAPYSDYRKTLWYLTYDVTEFLREGENVVSVICGNGWYNENINTHWYQNKAEWRDMPKVILELSINGKVEVNTDSSWKYNINSPFTYNELRVGEHYDSRLYDEKWNRLDCDETDWDFVQLDTTPPKGVFRKCECEPIRECALYAPKKMFKVSDDKVIFDFGQNMSGYVKLRTNQAAGDKIILRHVEEINDDLTLNYNDMNNPFFYPESPFQESEFICCGKDFVYTPMFAYFGFRYVEVTGLKNPSLDNVTAAFVHQDVKTTSHFECSDHLLNALFDAGIKATWSNMHYHLTDCPTREKHGWFNDAQASADQILTNLDSKKFFVKWMQDIFDSMREDGRLPALAPTPDWIYESEDGVDYNGPVGEGALFEIPYRIYLHTGDDSMLKAAYPYFIRSLENFFNMMDENGDISYGLGDWAAPNPDTKMDAVFPNKILIIKFLRIKKLTEELLGMDTSETEKTLEREICDAKRKYLTADGRCSIDRQTAVAMLIFFDIYDDIAPLKKQLKEMIEKAGFHHDCGMLGMRFLYHALSKCGLSDYAFRIITAVGPLTYRSWLEHGMTTMFEHWKCSDSKNHHMYSDVMTWMTKHILGIKQAEDSVGLKKVEIAPNFFDTLSYAKGHIDTVSGKVCVAWERAETGIRVMVDVPENMTVTYKGKTLPCGHHEFIEK